ncbi:hypothetical protein QOT17_012420 [Balamuthia mandrillaris]
MSQPQQAASLRPRSKSSSPLGSSVSASALKKSKTFRTSSSNAKDGVEQLHSSSSAFKVSSSHHKNRDVITASSASASPASLSASQDNNLNGEAQVNDARKNSHVSLYDSNNKLLTESRQLRQELLFSSSSSFAFPKLSLLSGSNVAQQQEQRDYSYSDEQPFTFDPALTDMREKVAFSIKMESDDFLKTLEEPDTGLEPDFDRTKLEKGEKHIVSTTYTPYVFNSGLPPLRPFEEIKEAEKLEEIGAISSKKNDNNVTCIRLDQSLPPKQLKGLGKLISTFKNLSILVLRGVGIKKLDSFLLPKLQFCDLSRNNIQEVAVCVTFLKNSPYIEDLQLCGNPVASKPNYRQRIIGNSSRWLRELDNEPVDLKERLRSIMQYGPKQAKLSIGQLRWDLCFSETQEVKAMKTWQPEQIVMVSLSKQGLTCFNVSSLVHLEYLDLSRNKITETRGMGLERCSQIQHLNLANNLISERKESLQVFAYMRNLRYLLLRNNPIAKSSNYRLQVIFATKFLKGTNRTTGLVELDEEAITIDERIDALNEFKCNVDIPIASQVKNEVLSQVHNCLFPNCKLEQVNLFQFAAVTYLDLSFNNLKDVNGLENLKYVKYLYLLENPKLKIGAVLTRLQKTKTLEHISLFVKSVEDHPCHPDNKKYRARVLKALLRKNKCLVLFDQIPISPLERVEAFASMKGAKAEDVEQYRFDLAVTLAVTPPLGRKGYHPGQVKFGMQYQPDSVTKLLQLHSMELTSSALSFAQFSNLSELNLSHNRLTEITGIGLQFLKKLAALDVSFNNISGSLSKLGKFINTLASLECIALRGNPIMKTAEDRLKLISCIPNLHQQIDCRLRVIDTEISINERLKTFRLPSSHHSSKLGLLTRSRSKKALKGDAMESAEKFRERAIAFLRIPSHVSSEELSCLDLHDCGLASFDLKPYPNLTVLSFKANVLSSLKALDGLLLLKKLKALDLRHNQLEKLDEVVDLINWLPSIENIGISHNKMTNFQDYRAKFLEMLPELHEKRMSLVAIDDKIITLDETCAAWKNPPHDPQLAIISLRKVPQNVALKDVVELNLSSFGFSSIDLRSFKNLKKLSLKGNHLSSSTISDSGVIELKQLEALDISDNNIDDFGLLEQIGRELTCMVSLWVDSNPCFPQNDAQHRMQLISRLPQMTSVGETSLVWLNGYRLSWEERCGAAEGRLQGKEMEDFKMDLLFEALGLVHLLKAKTSVTSTNANNKNNTHKKKKKAKSTEDSEAEATPEKNGVVEEKNVSSMSVKGFGLSSIHRLKGFVGLVWLDLSYNNLTRLEEDVFLALTSLKHLDLRENQLEEKGSELLSVFIKCPSLRILYLQHSTADKSKTTSPKHYLRKVCSVLHQLEMLDSLPNPFFIASSATSDSPSSSFISRAPSGASSLLPTSDDLAISQREQPHPQQNGEMAYPLYSPSSPFVSASSAQPTMMNSVMAIPPPYQHPSLPYPFAASYPSIDVYNYNNYHVGVHPPPYYQQHQPLPPYYEGGSFDYAYYQHYQQQQQYHPPPVSHPSSTLPQQHYYIPQPYNSIVYDPSMTTMYNAAPASSNSPYSPLHPHFAVHPTSFQDATTSASLPSLPSGVQSGGGASSFRGELMQRLPPRARSEDTLRHQHQYFANIPSTSTAFQPTTSSVNNAGLVNAASVENGIYKAAEKDEDEEEDEEWTDISFDERDEEKSEDEKRSEASSSSSEELKEEATATGKRPTEKHEGNDKKSIDDGHDDDESEASVTFTDEEDDEEEEDEEEEYWHSTLESQVFSPVSSFNARSKSSSVVGQRQQPPSASASASSVSASSQAKNTITKAKKDKDETAAISNEQHDKKGKENDKKEADKEKHKQDKETASKETNKEDKETPEKRPDKETKDKKAALKKEKDEKKDIMSKKEKDTVEKTQNNDSMKEKKGTTVREKKGKHKATKGKTKKETTKNKLEKAPQRELAQEDEEEDDEENVFNFG